LIGLLSSVVTTGFGRSVLADTLTFFFLSYIILSSFKPISSGSFASRRFWVEDDIKLVFKIDGALGIDKGINVLLFSGAIEILGCFAGSLSNLASSFSWLIEIS
jgi:hypothetical protein